MPASLKSRLPFIAVELPAKVDAAVGLAAEAIAESAKAKVALGDDPHHIRDDIHVERVGVAEYSVIAGKEETFYGHILEHGSSKMAPRPFLVPALEENEDTAVHLVQAALDSL